MQKLEKTVVWIAVGCLVSIVAVASCDVAKSSAQDIIRIQEENERLTAGLKNMQDEYAELEEDYKNLKRDTDRERKAVKTRFFGEDTGDVNGRLKIKDNTETADKDFNKSWKKEVESGILQLIAEGEIGDAKSFTLTDRIIFSADKMKAYTGHLDEDEKRQVGIIYDPYYDDYLYFYQKLPKDQDSSENGQEQEARTSGSESASRPDSSMPGTTVTQTTKSVQPTEEEQEIAEETDDTSEVADFAVYYPSGDILAYIDSHSMSVRLEEFLRSSGYEGTLACIVEEEFEVDNQNNYVIFTILINETDLVQAIYDREIEEYRFTF